MSLSSVELIFRILSRPIVIQRSSKHLKYDLSQMTMMMVIFILLLLAVMNTFLRGESSNFLRAPKWVHCLFLDRTLAKFTELKRNKRFDNFIIFVGVQGSLFHIAAGSHPVQEAWGSQDSLYRGQIKKLLQCGQKPYQQIPLIITIQKKYSLT